MNIIYFDGVCELCDASVQFVLKRDRAKLFYFASLQSNYAKKILPAKYTESQHLRSVYLQTPTRFYEKSDVAIQVFKLLKGPYYYLAIFLSLFPRPIRNLVYDFLAKHRYAIFGKKEVCGIEVHEYYKSRILS